MPVALRLHCPWPPSRSQHWTLNVSALFQQREGKAGSNPFQHRYCRENTYKQHVNSRSSHHLQSPWGSGGPPAIASPHIGGHMCQAYSGEPPNHWGPEAQAVPMAVSQLTSWHGRTALDGPGQDSQPWSPLGPTKGEPLESRSGQRLD